MGMNNYLEVGSRSGDGSSRRDARRANGLSKRTKGNVSIRSSQGPSHLGEGGGNDRAFGVISERPEEQDEDPYGKGVSDDEDLPEFLARRTEESGTQLNRSSCAVDVANAIKGFFFKK